MIVLDTAALLYLLDPSVPAEPDPSTGNPVSDVQTRIQHFVADLSKKNETIVIPTPALAELLILAGNDGPAIHARLSKTAPFKIEPFDERAAIELTFITAKSKATGDKKAGSTATMAKVKFDRQIVAIAKALGADAVFSGDDNVRKFSAANGLKVLAIWDLPLPPRPAQYEIFAEKKDGS